MDCGNIVTALPRSNGHKINYVTIFKEDSKSQSASKSQYWFKSTAILLNGWIFSIGGASAVKGLHVQPAQQAFFGGLIYFGSKIWC